MDEQLRIILIIIVSVSIFGLLVFVFVKNYIRQLRENSTLQKLFLRGNRIENAVLQVIVDMLSLNDDTYETFPELQCAS